ncbi:MAG TPA: acyltransferase [Bacteroidales bacterium]|nr:acyltransferase [Bacteroidales bacterium]HQI69776.1 acyltransferase [Bacteroidales bacterium]
MDIEELKLKIFNITSFTEFNEIALQIFQYQYKQNTVYHQFIDLLPVAVDNITSCYDIPCLPVEFFKSHEIRSVSSPPELIFISSGTTSSQRGQNQVFSKDLYEKSITTCFTSFFGNPQDHIVLALVPDYQKEPQSSLAFMLDFLIKKSGHEESGFYLNNTAALKDVLTTSSGKKKILFGISWALMAFAEQNHLNLKDVIIIETGGMKGRRKEITRQELHGILKDRLGVAEIFSEYSMCELMSQAYSVGKGRFKSPPWMKIYIREFNDPFARTANEKSGGINIIDLANLFTCSFISTKDVGVMHADGTFEVHGRFDDSDIRGCSQMV